MSSLFVLLSSFVAASTVTILKWFHKEHLEKKGQILSAQPKQQQQLHYYYHHHHQEQEQQQQKQNHNQHHYHHHHHQHHHQQQQQQYNRHYTEKHYSYYYYHQNHRMNNGKHCCRINLTTVLLILCLITRIACGQEMGNIMVDTSNIIESFEDRQHEYGLVDGYVNFGHGNSDSYIINSHQYHHDHDGHVAAMAEMTKHGTRRSGSRNRGEVMTGTGLVPGSRTPYTTVPTTTVLTTTRRFKTPTTAVSTTTTTTTTWATTIPIITDDMLSTMISTFLNVSDNSSVNSAVIRNGTGELEPPGLRYSIPQMVILAIVASILSILTVAGNVMVMISFKIDKQLQTISNYFLFSLAIADFAIGLISMPLFTVTTILGYWPLGPYICDTWLALDYLASNASVLNLLIISFDRYFSVTRPLTYRAKRTTSRAAIMIGAAWGISLLLWPPWIYSWPYIEGKRTVPEYECYIQFIETNHYITFGTAIAAFYVPVTVMCFLYYRIWRETKKRQKDLPNLQAGKKDSSKRSNSSDENTAVNHSNVISVTQMAGIVGAGIGGGGGGIVGASNNNTSGGDPSSTDGTSGWRRPRSESSADAESVYLTNAVMSDSGYAHGLHSRRSSTATTGHQTGGGAGHHHLGLNRTNSGHNNCYGGIKEWCIAWWHSGREDSDGDYGYDAEEPSDLGYATPVSIETPLQSSVSRCTSMNVIRDPYAQGGRTGLVSIIPDVSPTPIRPPLAPLSQLQDMAPRDSRSLPNSNRLGSRSVSQDSVYTILIRLPPDGGTEGDRAPSIKMIQDDVPLPVMTVPPRRPLPSRDSEYSLPLARRASHAPDIRIPLNAKIIPKPLAKPQPAPRITKKKKKSQEKRQETKAAKTLSAILLSFIITWTPYNILVLLKPLTACTKCIPQELWDFFYALCYINSTINPVCYALCNASFRRTYVRILTCKWHTRNREAMTRGVYN